MGSTSKQWQVLLILFPGFNVMDMTGPAEVIGNSRIRVGPGPKFHLSIGSSSEVTTSCENVPVKRHISIDELLATNDSAGTRLAEYDILIIPGGPPNYVREALDKEAGFLEVVKRFGQQPPKAEGDRWLISVCTGAAFLGAAGLFHGRVATTHWSFLDDLKAICAQAGRDAGTKSAEIVRKRWVDAGTNQAGVRVVSSGGVSCGIDCTLWMVSKLIDTETARAVALGMDYDWKFSPSEVTGGYILAAS